jgi:ribosomal protein L4
MNPEYLDPDSSDRSVTADINFRQEPDEDENEEEETKTKRKMTKKKMTRKATTATRSERTLIIVCG